MRRWKWAAAAVAGLAAVVASASCRTSYPDVVWVEAARTGEERTAALARPLEGLVPEELKVVGSLWIGDEPLPRRIDVHEEDAFQNPVESFLGLGVPESYLRSGVTCAFRDRTLVAYGRPVGDLHFTLDEPYLEDIAAVDRERGPAMREQADRIRANELHAGW